MYRDGILLCIVAFGLHIVTGDNIPTALQFQSRDDKVNNVDEFTESQMKLSKKQANELDINNIRNKDCNVNAGNASMVDITIDTALPNSSYICDEGNMCKGEIKQPGAPKPSAPTLKICPQDKPITIVVAKSSNTKTCGGDGTVYFNLYCLTGNNITGAVGHAINFTVQRKGDVGQATPKPKEEYEVLGITMEFYKDSAILPDHGQVAIGQIVYVLISGPNGIGLLVRNCTAYNQGKSEKIELLTISGGYSAENAGGVLLGPFMKNCNTIHNYTSKTCFDAQLHAFHFKNSMEVSLECSIDVCSDPQDQQCKTKTARRRRSSNLQKHVLRESMIVYDELHGADVEESSSVKAIGDSFFLTMILGVLLAFIGYF